MRINTEVFKGGNCSISLLLSDFCSKYSPHCFIF